MESSDQKSLELLRDALNEAQMTVRGYDTKAQIVGVGYIIALGIVVQINALLPSREVDPLTLVLLSWVVVVFPIFHFGHVLYPTRKTAPTLSQEQDATLKRVLYVEPEKHNSIKELRASAAACDLIDEYSYELLKVSKLRELKRRRFLRGLISAAAAFIILFISHLLRTAL